MSEMVEKAPVKTRWLTGAKYIAPKDLDRSLAVKNIVEAARKRQSSDTSKQAE